MANPNTTIRDNSNDILKWPQDIDSEENGKALVFHVFQYSKDGTEAREKSEAKESIVLPLPAQLDHSDQHNWQNVDSAILGGAMEAYNSDADWQATGMAALSSGFQGFIRQAFGEGAGVAAAAQTGKVQNPRELVGFERTSFKTHSFSIKMVPRNEDESRAIKQIVSKFREYSHPDPVDSDTAFLFRIPHIFRIEFLPKILNEKLYRPGDSMLTSVSISYGDEGGIQLFDGTYDPVETTITLEFQEMFVKTATQIREEAGND